MCYLAQLLSSRHHAWLAIEKFVMDRAVEAPAGGFRRGAALLFKEEGDALVGAAALDGADPFDALRARCPLAIYVVNQRAALSGAVGPQVIARLAADDDPS